MANGSLDRIAHPLRELAEAHPDALFPVVIVPAPGGPVAAVADRRIAEALLRASNTLADLVPNPAGTGGDEPQETFVPARPAGMPMLTATLTGRHVLQFDEFLAPDVPVQMRRSANESSPQAPSRGGFDPATLVARRIAEPLASKITKEPGARYSVILVLESGYASGRQTARERVRALLENVVHATDGPDAPVDVQMNEHAAHPYVYARLTGAQVLALLDLDRNTAGPALIFRVWEDTQIQALITKSIATVKADAAQIAFSAVGRGIVWAVLDSGIDATHPHFATHANLHVELPLRHRDFRATGAVRAPNENSDTPDDDPGALQDAFGHGTHVAGILAGAWSADAAYVKERADAAKSGTPKPADPKQQPIVLQTARNEKGAEERTLQPLSAISGMAPECTLLSYRVLDDKGAGNVSSIIDAFDEIQRLNDHGRKLVIHGVNVSAGYPFDATWFACGQSPICVEVDRLVKSGVVVVVAAGNSGYGYLSTAFTKNWAAGLAMTINDPGNADLAITVGSTHRDAPHRYGVSYFSSKGPTGDGRMKPDVVAPGERIVSAASRQARLPNTVTNDDGTTSTAQADDFTYREDSGTSMAAPHVSGLIAAFLSIRNEYIGHPEDVKALFVANATDLRRERSYQGSGLVDLMRTIQAV